MWTEAPDLLVPHRPTIPQRHGIRDREAEQDDIGPAVRESPVLLMITEGVPQTQRDVHPVDNLPGTFQDLKEEEDSVRNSLHWG